MRSTLVACLFSIVAGGCYADATYSARGTYVSDPDMVEAEPGVQVIADYDYPVFYSDGFYWRFEGGSWYRSHDYRGGWGYVEAPPVAVARIRSPQAYVHYRPSGYHVRRRAAPQRERIVRRTTVIRDHRR